MTASPGPSLSGTGIRLLPFRHQEDAERLDREALAEHLGSDVPARDSREFPGVELDVQRLFQAETEIQEVQALRPEVDEDPTLGPDRLQGKREHDRELFTDACPQILHGHGAIHAVALRIARHAFCPPKPNEFEITSRSAAALGRFGTTSMSKSGVR